MNCIRLLLAMVETSNLLSCLIFAVYIYKNYIYIITRFNLFLHLALWFNLDIFLCNRFEMLVLLLVVKVARHGDANLSLLI